MPPPWRAALATILGAALFTQTHGEACDLNTWCAKLRVYPLGGGEPLTGAKGAAGIPLTNPGGAAPASEAPGAANLPTPREILRKLYVQDETPPLSSFGISQAMVYWGLFVYHDMFDTFDAVGAPEQIPCDDGVADLQCPNVNECAANPAVQAETIPLPPTRKDAKTGLALNAATAFMDLDGIYGRTQAVADSLRTFADGKMKLAPSGLPLFDAATNTHLIADQRNAQLPGTLALHALLLREHNWRAGNLTGAVTIDGTSYARYVDYVEDWLGCTPIPCTKWGEEEIFQAARQWTIAAAQHITLHEYIPRLLGLPSSLEASNPYSAAAPADPSVSIAAAVALRWPYFGFGPIDRILDKAWQTVPDHDYRPVGTVCGPAAVAALINNVGIEAIMRGMMLADASAVDASLPPYSDTLTCMGQPVLDVQTTRDMGAPSYNDARAALGLPRVATFDQISANATVTAQLEDLYGDVDAVDLLVGGLAEALNASSTSLLSPTLTTALWPLMINMKPSDLLWHDHRDIFEDVRTTSLSTLLNRTANRDQPGFFPLVTEVATDSYPLDPFSAAQFSMLAAPTADTVMTITFVQDVFSMTWSILGSNIQFTIMFTGMNAGYFGIGLGNRMISADIFAFCDFSQLSATNQLPSCTDRNGIANDLPPQDTSMQGHDDITLKKADLNGATNTWTVVLQRPLSADDATIDQSITNLDTNMIWSYNPDAVAQHSFDHRGINTVNFYSGTNSAQMTSQQSFFALHGLVMLFAWGLFGPMALYVARYKKHWRNWLEVHEVLASFAVEASVPIAIGAFASAGWVFKSAHGKIGAALFCLIIVQFGSGVLRRMGIQNRGNKYFGTNYDKLHQFNKVYHRVSGRFTVCLGVANVMIGLHIISPMDSVLQLSGLDTAGSDQLNISVSGFNYISLYVFPAWICIMLIAFGAAEVALWAGRKKARKKMIRQLNLPTYTMEEFNDRVLQGEKWLIVNDAVVNVEEYQKVHPGGSKVMKESIGLDVTKEILGLRGVEQGIVNGGHKHSAKAWTAIQKLVVAYVDHENDVMDYAPGDLSSNKLGDGSAGTAATSGNGSGNGGSGSSNSSRRRAFGAESAFVKFVLRNKKILANDSKGAPVVGFVFEPQTKSNFMKSLAPGFYHKFRVVHQGSVIQRSYTPVGLVPVAGKPGAMGFEYFIRLYPGGQMSSALAKMKIGDSVRVQGPFEIREISKADDHIFMIAGGTGITPMLQLVQCHIDKQGENAGVVARKVAMNELSAPPLEEMKTAVGADPGGARQKRSSMSAPQDSVKAGQDGTQKEDTKLVPALTLALLWQTRSDTDAFCLPSLQELAYSSDLLVSANKESRANFYYTNYSTHFNIDSGEPSPGGRRHDYFLQHRKARRYGILSALAGPTAGAAAADTATIAEQQQRAAAAGGGGGGGGEARSLSRQRRGSLFLGRRGSSVGRRGSTDSTEPLRGAAGDSRRNSNVEMLTPAAGAAAVHDDVEAGGGGGSGAAAAADTNGKPPLSNPKKLWRKFAYVVSGFEAHAPQPVPQRAAARRGGSVNIVDGDDGAETTNDTARVSISGGSGNARKLFGRVTESAEPPRHTGGGGGSGDNSGSATPPPPLQLLQSMRFASEGGAAAAADAFDGARNQMVEGKLTVAALRAQLAPLLAGLLLSEADAARAPPRVAHAGNSHVIISGPPGFVDMIEGHLRELEIPESILRFLD